MNLGLLRRNAAPHSPLSDRICDAVALGFGIWTICAHVSVASGGTLNQLLIGFAVALSLAIAVLIAHARRAGTPRPLEPEPRLPERASALRLLQLGGLAIGIGLTAAAVRIDDPLFLWWSVVASLGVAAAAFLVSEEPFAPAPLRGGRPEIALWLLALSCVVITTLTHRPDMDDAFYVNVAVAAADFPDLPLLRRDTMLGVENLPLHMPAHRIHSYELWNGAISYVSGIPAIYVFHWISAGIFALLVPLAHAKLFRLLTPRFWPWAVGALLLVLVGAGETHRWYGNFAFVRMWQGKGIYLFVFMPLVYSYAIQFALRPSPSRWVLLWAAQTAAVGCSSSAVWAAPVGSFLALCCALRTTPEGLKRFFLGASASAYVLGVGFVLKQDLQGLLEPMIAAHEPGVQLANALRVTLGNANLLSFATLTILVAWACCGRGLAQRFAIVLPLAVWLVLLNPYLDRWISAHLTGPSYWRSMWSLPLPILMALVLISPLQLARDRASRVVAGAACFGLAAVFLAVVPKFGALSQRNGGAGGVGIRLGRPGPKAPEAPYRWAAALNAAVPPGASVVAPPEISVWIPTFHNHAHPLQARKLYLERHRAQLGDDDVNLRLFMSQYVAGGGQRPDASRLFAQGLAIFRVKGVLLRSSARAIAARRVLARSGFERTVHAIDYEIWVRR